MKYNVLAISGSIEEVSLATNILKAAKTLNIDTLAIDICPINTVPLLNVDLFKDGFPKEIEEIRQKAFKADGILFASPQFFGKVSPAMKNSYDWLSYSPDLQHPSPLRNMPATLISLGLGEDGSNVQKHFLQMGQFCRLKIMGKPNLHFSTANKQIYGQKLEINQKGNEELEKYLQYFSDFIGKKRKNQ